MVLFPRSLDGNKSNRTTIDRGANGRRSLRENDAGGAQRGGLECGSGALGEGEEEGGSDERRGREMKELMQQPFIQVTLPILIGFVAVGVWQNKRFDDLRAELKEFRAEMMSLFGEVNKRLDKVDARLDRIDETLRNYGQRIAVLEDRSSPHARR